MREKLRRLCEVLRNHRKIVEVIRAAFPNALYPRDFRSRD
jgi:hypothetical protein